MESVLTDIENKSSKSGGVPGAAAGLKEITIFSPRPQERNMSLHSYRRNRTIYVNC